MARRRKATGAIGAYDDEFLDCRSIGHAWEVRGYYRDEGGLTRRWLECARCETERRDRWDGASGERYPASYHYTEGYKAPSGDPFSTIDVRLEVMRRVDVYATEDDMLASLTNGRRHRS